MDLSGLTLAAVDLSAAFVVAVFLGPPLVATVWGAWITLRGPNRPWGVFLFLLGIGQLVAVTLATSSSCTPFDSENCSGFESTALDVSSILWFLCVAALAAGVAVALARATAGRCG